MEKEMRRLPDAELDVMQAIWSCSQPASRTDIEAKIRTTHPMAPTTLLTLLSRLADRGFVEIGKVGRGSTYTALVTKSSYLAAQSRRFVEKLCGGSMSAFAAALCDSGLDEKELAELRQALERGML